MQRFFRLALSFLLLACSYSYSTIRTLRFLVDRKTGHEVYLVSDTHLDEESGTISTLQHEELLEIAEALDAVLIAEDFETFLSRQFPGNAQLHKIINGELTTSKARSSDKEMLHLLPATPGARSMIPQPHILQPAYGGSPLDGLIKDAMLRGRPCFNAEFRFASSASMLGMPVGIKTVLDINEAFIKKIRSTKTTPILKQFYEKCIAQYNNNRFTQLIKNKARTNPSCTLKSLVGAATKTELRLHNSILLDCLAMQGWHSFGTHQPTLIVAGGWHILNMLQVFIALGYEVVKTVGKEDVIAGNKRTMTVVNIKEAFEDMARATSSYSYSPYRAFCAVRKKIKNAAYGTAQWIGQTFTPKYVAAPQTAYVKDSYDETEEEESSPQRPYRARPISPVIPRYVPATPVYKRPEPVKAYQAYTSSYAPNYSARPVYRPEPVKAYYTPSPRYRAEPQYQAYQAYGEFEEA